MNQIIRFEDGAAYERGMGVWSQLVGTIFLEWLAPEPGQRWLDIGCGNGAFTELVLQHCAPAAIDGIDPSAGQLEFARNRRGASAAPVHQGASAAPVHQGASAATFHQGDAYPLPFDTDSTDVAVMALVIFFLDDPAAGLAEMARVVRPGGHVAAYAWDIPARSFPLEPVQAELRALGHNPLLPPNAGIASAGPLRDAFAAAGLTDLRERSIAVTRVFPNFETFWGATVGIGSMSKVLDAMPEADLVALKSRVHGRLTSETDGQVSYTAAANAIVGCVPG